MHKFFLFWLTIVLVFPAITCANTLLATSDFSTDAEDIPPEPWSIVRFDENIPATIYRRVNRDRIEAIEASADASMALLARPINIDLQQTPVLCWRWRVERLPDNAGMKTKAGDDYAARVYVAFELPTEAMALTTRIKLGLARRIYGEHLPDAAINCVWDNRYPIGTHKPNAYIDRAHMLVVQSSSELGGQWLEERRNVLTDAKRYIGTKNPQPSLLAIATDTDDTGKYA
ncbi:MAG: DUF3047 domain-containing protein [Gammaproteobacteria bacterium]